jgi:hypothetical protein
MATRRLRLTPELQERLCSYIHAGGFPHVAAEALGVPRELFDTWLRRGSGPRARRPYRDFAAAVRRAAAEARLSKETATFRERPLDWLRYGPGKETEESPGWTAAPAPTFQPAPAEINPLEIPEVVELLNGLVGALGPIPEAREALERFLERASAPRA